MPIRQIKTAYNHGEMSEYMAAREDTSSYHNGASKIINATVLPHGGFVKRSGTEFIATALNKSTLFPFEFSVDDALVLEFSNLLTRFYKDGAIINDGVGTETIPSGNIVAHWLCNERTGTTAVDDNGGTHDGTISVDASLVTADGKVGSGSFDLDGQYDITVADSDDFSFNDGDDGLANATTDLPFSLVCWGKYTDEGGLTVLLSKWRDEAITSEWRFSLTSEGKPQLHLADTSVSLTGDRVSQWKLNESAGDTSVVDTAGVQNGVSSANTSVLAATGKINGAFDFDLQYSVEIADNALYSFGDSSNDSDFSIAAWAFVATTGTQQTIFSKWEDSPNLREYSFHIDPAGRLTLNLADEDTNESVSATADVALASGWHFVVCTYSGTGTGATAADRITLYVDSVAVNITATNNASYVSMVNTVTKPMIGARNPTTPAFWFAGKIDNVVLFDKTLTQADVNVLYNSGEGTEGMGSAQVVAVADDTLELGWHLLCATYSAPADESTAADGIILYVDGVAVNTTATNDANYTAMQNGAEEVRIGSQRNAGDSANEKFWEDRIDEISVYSDVLTPTEIAGLHSIAPLTIVSPYTSEQAADVHVTQSADVMYMAHEDIHPKKLSRFSDTDWTLVDVPFTGGPFLVENTIDTSLVGFARTGGTARSGFYFPTGTIGTVTATGEDNQPFNVNMVGALWLIKHSRPDNTTSTQDNDTNVAPTTFTNAVRTKGDYTFDISKFVAGTDSAKLWRKEGNGEWQEFRTFTAATAFSATEDEDDTFYAFSFSVSTMKGTFTAKAQTNYGIVRITGFTSSTVVTATVIDQVLSDNSTDAAVTTAMWAEGAWSDFRGYPRTVVFFEDRLWWASSTNNPDTLWSSQSGLYEEMGFTDLGLDNEGITFPINDNEVSQIQWMQARQVMAVGAANKEYRFGATDPDKAVTPVDRKATPQTSEGSHTIQPVILKDSIFFFQSLGRKLGKMKFDAITENFDVEDATMRVYRLFDSSPVDVAVQRVPDPIIWTVREDGVAPTLTYEPKEDVLGWARQIFGNTAAVETPTGTVESVAVIHGATEDEVWVSVLWANLSARHIMRFKPRDFGSDVEDAFYVDSGITYDGVAASTMTGGTHLIGETVAVFADGVVFDDAVVDGSGEIVLKLATVTTTAETVQWGLPYTMKVRTMRHSIPQEGTTIQSKIKRISKTTVRFIRSLLGQAGQEYAGVEKLQPIAATFSTEAQDTKPNNRLTQGGFSEDAYTTIVSSDPVPFTALAVIVDVEVEKL